MEMTSPYGERREKLKETARKGGQIRKAELRPSEVFDWDAAIVRFKVIMAHRYSTTERPHA
jgi:hypothetical protein